MRTLTNVECLAIAGSGQDDVRLGVSVAAGLIGGYAASTVAGYFGPLSTLVGTMGVGVGGAVLGTVLFPGVGTVIGGLSGAGFGYLLSSTVVNLGAFCGGGLAAGYFAYTRF